MIKGVFYMKEKLSLCPVCSFQGESSSFVKRKKGKVVEKIYYECPTCHNELLIKHSNTYIIISLIALCLFLGAYLMGISLSTVGIVFGIVIYCIWGLQKIGLLPDNLRFIQKKHGNTDKKN